MKSIIGIGIVFFLFVTIIIVILIINHIHIYMGMIHSIIHIYTSYMIYFMFMFIYYVQNCIVHVNYECGQWVWMYCVF